MSKRVADVAPSASKWTPDVNLADHLLFRHLREDRGGCDALLYGETAWSYADVADYVSKAAALLRRRGITAGDSVVLVLPDSPAFVVAFFAALQVGAIAVPVNPTLSATETLNVTTRVHGKLAIVDEDLVNKIHLDGVPIIFSGDCCSRTSQFEHEIATSQPDYGQFRSPRTRAYCLFSSGTTGVPKGICHVHSDILHCIEAFSISVLKMVPTDRVLAVPKLTFGYGLGGNLLSSFYVGAAVILVPQPSSQQTISKAAQQHWPTLFLGQPRLISSLLQDAHSAGFSVLRLAISAGEVLVSALYDKWRRAFDVELLDAFGSTEVGHVFISNCVGDVHPNCAGRVLPGYRVRILDDEGIAVGPNKVGHLWVAGPSLVSEYWEDLERTRLHFRNGWVKTGDLFRQDERGYLFAEGRADDMIKAGCGQWVSPFELEAVLSQDDSVADAVVVGFSDHDGIVRPKACVKLRPGTRPTLEIENRLKLMVVQRWPEQEFKHIGVVEFVSEIPRSSNGKVQRFRLRSATLTEFSYDC